MQYLLNFIRKYPLTCIIIVGIWILCFIDIPETPLSDVSLIDKWTHMAMYFVLSAVVCIEQCRAERHIYNNGIENPSADGNNQSADSKRLSAYGKRLSADDKRQKKANTRFAFSRFFVWGVIAPIIMGGLIEILQAHCTGGRRSGDWLDFAADAIGSALALIICTLLARCRARA